MEYAALFDLDETLFDRRGSLRRFLADQFGKLGPSPFRNVDVAINDFLILDNRGLTPKLGVYKTLLAKAGCDDPTIVADLFDDYEQNACRFTRAFDGMDTLLRELKQSGIKTGIVSNGQTHIQLRNLLALNLDRRVDVYLISESEDVRKPEPEIFLRAARKLAIDPAQCIFIGDSPTADIVGAHAVGMKTIWFPNGAVWPADLALTPDATVHSLKDAGAVIRRWTTGS